MKTKPRVQSINSAILRVTNCSKMSNLHNLANRLLCYSQLVPLTCFRTKLNCATYRCGSRIWSRGGPQLLRPKVADIAKRSRASEASILRLGSRALKRALEAFGFLMLKYAFSHILETLFVLFLTSILTPKVDKKRALDFTSINLRHSDMLHLFFNLHEKVML